MKAEIDKFFTENYDFVIEVTKKKIAYFKRNIDPESLVANSYLYLINHKDLKHESDIPIWVLSYINTELSFYNSQTLRKESVTVSDEKAPELPSRVDIEAELDHKLKVEAFKNNLDRVEQILWEVYYERGKRSSGDLAEHFNFDRTSAWAYKKRLLTKLNEYAKTEERL
jgi:hypothetical protein